MSAAPTAQLPVIGSAASAVQKYSPTYRLDPKVPYDRLKCEEIIKTIFDTTLTKFVYDSNEAENLSRTLSQEILNKVKDLNFDRYKFVCVVTIGEKNMQGFCDMFRCLWDTQRDGFAFNIFHTQSMFAIGIIYAMYLD